MGKLFLRIALDAGWFALLIPLGSALYDHRLPTAAALFAAVAPPLFIIITAQQNPRGGA